MSDEDSFELLKKACNSGDLDEVTILCNECSDIYEFDALELIEETVKGAHDKVVDVIVALCSSFDVVLSPKLYSLLKTDHDFLAAVPAPLDRMVRRIPFDDNDVAWCLDCVNHSLRKGERFTSQHLNTAAKHKFPELVELILEHEIPPTTEAVENACMPNYVSSKRRVDKLTKQCVSLLLNAGVEATSELVQFASRHSNTSIVKKIARRSSSKPDVSCLKAAIQGNNTPVVDWLLAKGIKPNHDCLALTAPHFGEMGNKLIKHGARDVDGSLLRCAARKGNLGAARLLIITGAPVTDDVLELASQFRCAGSSDLARIIEQTLPRPAHHG